MKTLIRFGCRLASMGQPIGRIELALRLLCLAAALVGGIGTFVPSLHDRALNTFLLGFFGFAALATSHPGRGSQGGDNGPS